MERLLNLARGCVRAELRGANTALALERLADAGVQFWRVEHVDDFTLRLSLLHRDWPRARRAVRRAMCEAEAVHIRGTPALGRHMRRRPALPVCALSLLIAIFVSSFFIWDIEVVGNERVSDGEILRAMEDCGVHIGALWPDFEPDMIRNRALLKLPGLSWLTVNVRSSRAVVVVEERKEKPELYDAREPADVVSAALGIITKMSVLDGTPLVEKGDAVLPGETLVTGRREALFGGDVRYVHAKAEIEARTWYEITAVTPLSAVEKGYTGAERVRWALLFGRTRINIFDSCGKTYDSCDKIIAEYPLAVEGLFTLPLTLLRETLAEYEPRQVERDAVEAEAELKAALLLELSRRLDGRGEAVSTQFFSSERDGALTLTLRAECLEDIALEKPLLP